eukprot:3497459-Prymnesium_polylepis.1
MWTRSQTGAVPPHRSGSDICCAPTRHMRIHSALLERPFERTGRGVERGRAVRQNVGPWMEVGAWWLRVGRYFFLTGSLIPMPHASCVRTQTPRTAPRKAR